MGNSLGSGKDPDRDVIHSADASASDLGRIARTRPDLFSGIAAHPNADPELLAWLATNQDPAIQEALARRGWAPGWQQNTAQLSALYHGAIAATGHSPSPQDRNHSKRKWMLGVGAGLVLVLAVTGGIFGARFLSGSSYDKAHSQKAAVDLADVGRNAARALAGSAEASVRAGPNRGAADGSARREAQSSSALICSNGDSGGVLDRFWSVIAWLGSSPGSGGEPRRG